MHAIVCSSLLSTTCISANFEQIKQITDYNSINKQHGFNILS